MASKSARSFLTNFALFLMFHIAVFVQGDECPQQDGGPSTTNERAAKLSGTGYVCQTYIYVVHNQIVLITELYSKCSFRKNSLEITVNTKLFCSPSIWQRF